MTLLDQLERHEGRKRYPYVDTAGKLSIGVGRNLTDKGLSEDEIDYLLMNDVNECLNDLKTFAWWKALDEVRRNVLLDMRFQLGAAGFREFRLMLAAVAGGDYERAGDEMQRSDWFAQVKGRGKRLLKMMRTGVGLFVFCSLLGGVPLWAQPAHLGLGPATAGRAWPIVSGTAQEYPALVAQGCDLAGMEQLLRRMIWHLQLAGFQAGRQKNPSGAISQDKLAIVADGATRAYDVLSDRPCGTPFDVHMDEVFPANLLPDPGIADDGGPAPPPPNQPPVVIVQPPSTPLDLSGIERQIAALDTKLDGHIASTEAFQAQARGIWKEFFQPVLEFTGRYIAPAVAAWFLGKEVAQ